MTRGTWALCAALGSAAVAACTSGAPSGEPGAEGVGGLGGADPEGPVEDVLQDQCGDACDAEQTCCQGSCVELGQDAEHCGACDRTCSESGGVASCEDGQCVIACARGHVDCDGHAENGCESLDPGPPDAVELLRPLAGAPTGSVVTAALTGALRPSFSWKSAATGACAEPTYEIQVDDSCPSEGFSDCSFASPEIDETVAAANFTPQGDLPVADVVPVGTRYFWRVRACDQLGRCSAWSLVRYLDVGRDRQDVTGDGYPDLLLQSVTLRQDPYVIVPGGPQLGVTADGAAMDLAVLRTFDESGTTGGFSEDNPPVIRFVGDVDGDGFQDFVADGTDEDAYLPPDGLLTREEVVFCPTRLLYLGAAELSDIEPVVFSTSTWAPGGLAHNFGAGDFDGDGYADIWAAQSVDFVPGDASTPDHEPRVFLFRGRPDIRALPPPALEQSPDADFTAVWRPSGFIAPRPDDDGDLLGTAVEPGDFDGDGLVDVAVAVPKEHRIYLVLGGAAVGLIPLRSIPYGGPDVGAYDCRDVRLSVADLNGDGFDDLALNCAEQHLIEGYFGGDPLPEAMAFSERVVPETGWGLFDTLAADLDGDGKVELITGRSYGQLVSSEPTVWMFPGATFGQHAGAPVPLPVLNAAGYFGAADHNGDGFTDLVVAGSPASWIPGNGSVDLTEETSSGRAPVAPRIFVGPEGPIDTRTVGR